MTPYTDVRSAILEEVFGGVQSLTVITWPRLHGINTEPLIIPVRKMKNKRKRNGSCLPSCIVSVIMNRLFNTTSMDITWDFTLISSTAMQWSVNTTTRQCRKKRNNTISSQGDSDLTTIAMASSSFHCIPQLRKQVTHLNRPYQSKKRPQL